VSNVKRLGGGRREEVRRWPMRGDQVAVGTRRSGGGRNEAPAGEALSLPPSLPPSPSLSLSDTMTELRRRRYRLKRRGAPRATSSMRRGSVAVVTASSPSWWRRCGGDNEGRGPAAFGVHAIFVFSEVLCRVLGMALGKVSPSAHRKTLDEVIFAESLFTECASSSVFCASLSVSGTRYLSDFP
jgi:hypothetical protein